MFVGGCTGSTAGGVKVARVVLLARVVGREFRRMVQRHGVFTDGEASQFFLDWPARTGIGWASLLANRLTDFGAQAWGWMSLRGLRWRTSGGGSSESPRQ